VGCGTGIFTKQIVPLVPDGKVYGVDISQEMIKRARKSWSNIDRLSFKEARAHNLPFQDHSVNLILVVDTFHHIPKMDEALQELKRVLVPSGKLIIVDPDISTVLGKIVYKYIGSLVEHYERFLSRDGIKKMLNQDGFSILSQEIYRLHHFTAAQK
jgi:ubiquinone/menaquinone biosynthesis C-methylase UbiE